TAADRAWPASVGPARRARRPPSGCDSPPPAIPRRYRGAGRTRPRRPGPGGRHSSSWPHLCAPKQGHAECHPLAARLQRDIAALHPRQCARHEKTDPGAGDTGAVGAAMVALKNLLALLTGDWWAAVGDITEKAVGIA